LYNKVFDCEIANKEKNQIVIGNDVWIGWRAVIFGGIYIGNGAVIATMQYCICIFSFVWLIGKAYIVYIAMVFIFGKSHY